MAHTPLTRPKTIQHTRGIQRPQQAWEYEVSVWAGGAATKSGSMPDLTTNVKDVTVPAISVETYEINFKGRKVQHAGRDGSTKTVTITFWETEGRPIYTFFYNWLEQINSVADGSSTEKFAYKGEVEVKTFTAEGNEMTGKNVFYNAWPSELGDISFDYTTSDAMSFSVTFTFDENINTPNEQIAGVMVEN